MYRAQSDSDYPPENVNAADLAGVLWYLHNEVMVLCPRKYNITRIWRLKVTMKPTWDVYQGAGWRFMPFVAFDMGRCTVPRCGEVWQKYGFAVGCQRVNYGGLVGHWYSLPGPCPSQEVGNKSRACVQREPGGACRKVDGSRTCTYHAEWAGEVRLNELTGISDYAAFCAAGSREYDKQADLGVGLRFWDGLNDLRKCKRRVDKVQEFFQKKYPAEPAILDPPACTGPIPV